METETITPHLDDSALLNLVDQAGSPIELAVWTRHVLTCPSCAERLSLQREASDRVRVAIATIQLPTGFIDSRTIIGRAKPRGARARRLSVLAARPSLRLAAVLLILLLPIALVTPLRAAIANLAKQIWTQVAGDDRRSADDAPTAGGSVESDGLTISFTPAAEVLQLVIEQRQLSGDLVISRRGTGEGTLEADGVTDALVTGDAIRIRNNGSSNATYRLTVPLSVERVDVRIGDGPTATVAAQQLAEEWRTSLR